MAFSARFIHAIDVVESSEARVLVDRIIALDTGTLLTTQHGLDSDKHSLGGKTTCHGVRKHLNVLRNFNACLIYVTMLPMSWAVSASSILPLR